VCVNKWVYMDIKNIVILMIISKQEGNIDYQTSGSGLTTCES